MLALKNLREEEEAKLTWENTSCMLLINQLGCDMYWSQCFFLCYY